MLSKFRISIATFSIFVLPVSAAPVRLLERATAAPDPCPPRVSAGTVTAGSPPTTTASTSGANFGSCSVPEIEFGDGFDGRKETSFRPTDKTSFNHGSADNIAIITQFICDTLTNSCKANQAAKDLCAIAQLAASASTAKTGAQADAFNAAFGITKDFAAVPVVDDQGNVISTGTGAAASSVAAPSATTAASSEVSAPPSAATATSTAASSGIGNFGSCSVPQIKFGAGFDNRKETSFEPVDKTSFNHGSAQNINIITQFICDTLTNTCGADATAKATCATAEAAASAAAKGTGAQVDAFNAVFGITTQFNDVTPLDNQGNPVGASTAPVETTAAPPPATTTSVSTSANTNNAVTGSSASSVNLQTFTGALGGVTAPPVTAVGNGRFQVQGNSSFNDEKSAVTRSCDVQNNACANAANASGNKNSFTVAACNAQQSKCTAAA